MQKAVGQHNFQQPEKGHFQQAPPTLLEQDGQVHPEKAALGPFLLESAKRAEDKAPTINDLYFSLTKM